MKHVTKECVDTLGPSKELISFKRRLATCKKCKESFSLEKTNHVAFVELPSGFNDIKLHQHYSQLLAL